MKTLIFSFLISAAVVEGFRNGRAASSPFEEFPPYQRSVQHLSFRDQHQPFREQTFKSQHDLPYRPRTHRQETSYIERPSFTDQSLLRDYSPLKDQTFYENQPSFKDATSFKEQTPSYSKGTTFTNEEYRGQTSFRNEPSFQEQATFNDQYQFQQQQQAFRDDHRSFLDSSKSYPTDSYQKPMNSDKETGEMERQPLSFGGHSNYLKYGNHGLGFASVPAVSPYENVLSPNDETSTTTASTPTLATATHKSLLESTAPVSTSTITKLHVFSTTEPKGSSMKFAVNTMQDTKSNTLADVLATQSTQIATITPNVSVTANDHHPASLTTSSSLPTITGQSPIMTYQGPTLPPITFDASKLKEGLSQGAFYLTSDLKNKLQPSVLNIVLPQETKNELKNNVQNLALDYIMPDVHSNSLNPNMHRTVINYMLSEEPKNTLKNSMQNTWVNYLLQSPKRGLSFQQSSIPETVNYLPLTTLPERPKLTLPSIPIATLSAVSRPLQAINYISTTLPRVSILTQDPTASSSLPLGTTLVSGLSAGTPTSLSTGLSNSLPAALATGISGIPGSLSSSISDSLSTLNLGQSFQHMDPMRQLTMPKTQMYSPGTVHSPYRGLQLQLGGFGGMDYSLQAANLATRPMELGLTKMGLSFPEFTRTHVSPFAKVGYGQQIW